MTGSSGSRAGVRCVRSVHRVNDRHGPPLAQPLRIGNFLCCGGVSGFRMPDQVFWVDEPALAELASMLARLHGAVLAAFVLLEVAMPLEMLITVDV